MEIFKHQYFIRQILQTCPRISLQKLAIFLDIAANGNVDQNSVVHRSGLTQSAAHTHLSDLTFKNSRGGRGFDLIERKPHPAHAGARILSLTTKGKNLLEKAKASKEPARALEVV